jgi:hypothetical protein
MVLAAISALALLAGCANPQQQANEATEALKAQSKACNDAIINKPEYAALLPHTFTGAPPARELADETLPTPEEARLIVRRWDERAPCRAQFLEAAARPPINRPDIAQVFAAGYAVVAETAANFGHGQMTWAAFARTGWKTLQDVQRQLAAANEARWQQQAQQAEINRENALAAAAVLGAMPRPATYAPPQTIYVAPCTLNSRIAGVC